MYVRDHIKKEWADFKSSFTAIDKKLFFKVILIEVIIIALLAAGAFSLRGGMQSAVTGIEEMRSQLEALGGMTSVYAMQVRDETAIDVLGKIYLYVALFAIYALIVWSLLKNRIYDLLNKTRFSKPVCWRFFVLTVVWGFISVNIFLLVFNLMFVVVFDTFETQVSSRYAMFFVVTIAYLILCWFTIALFTALVKTGTLKGAVKGLWQSIKGSAHYIGPLVFSLIMFIAVNIIMFIYMMFGPFEGFAVIFTILLLLYITWMRFYYTARYNELTGKSAEPRQAHKKEHRSTKGGPAKHRAKHTKHAKHKRKS